MKLRSKVVIILVSVFLIYGAVYHSIQRFIILPGFQSIENEKALKNSKRVVQAIDREIYHLSRMCRDWAAWDDTYEFIKSSTNEYIVSNLVISAFTGNNLNLIYYCNYSPPSDRDAVFPP